MDLAIFLVSKLLDLIPNGDIICYSDIGCTFNKYGIIRFEEYLSLASNHDSLCFGLTHLEKKYTKMDTYKKIFPDTFEHVNTNQRMSGVFFLKNTVKNKKILEEIKNISIEKNHLYFNDNPSKEMNDINFFEHRQDQSVFSLISKKYNFFAYLMKHIGRLIGPRMENIFQYGLQELDQNFIKISRNY